MINILTIGSPADGPGVLLRNTRLLFSPDVAPSIIRCVGRHVNKCCVRNEYIKDTYLGYFIQVLLFKDDVFVFSLSNSIRRILVATRHRRTSMLTAKPSGGQAKKRRSTAISGASRRPIALYFGVFLCVFVHFGGTSGLVTASSCDRPRGDEHRLIRQYYISTHF